MIIEYSNKNNVCVWLTVDLWEEQALEDGNRWQGSLQLFSSCYDFKFIDIVVQISIFLPKTFNFAVKLYWPASFEMEHVHSPLCAEVKEGMLRRELYWSRDVTFAPKIEGNGSPSLSQRNVNGGSPLLTPQTVRVLIPSARPSWKENGSIIGGTASKKWTHEIEVEEEQ